MLKGPKKRLLQATALVFAMSPVTAVTQSAPLMETVPVTYSGLALDWFADSIRIVQPDGSLAEYRGPMPNLPLGAGDSISISFDLRKPRGIAFDTATYTGQTSASGTYRIAVNQTLQSQGASWQVIGGGAADATNTIPVNASAPLSASYSVAYDSATGETEIVQGESPAVATLAAQEQPAFAPPAQVQTPAGTVDPVIAAPASNPPVLAMADTASSPPVANLLDTTPRPVSTAQPDPAPAIDAQPAPPTETPPVELPFIEQSRAPGVSQTVTGEEPRSPVPVPAPGGLLLLAAALGILPLRKRLSART